MLYQSPPQLPMLPTGEPESLTTSAIVTTHLRLLEAGVPSLFMLDETTAKPTMLVFYETPDLPAAAQNEIKAVLGLQELVVLDDTMWAGRDVDVLFKAYENLIERFVTPQPPPATTNKRNDINVAL